MKKSVLITSHTHSAVDNILIRLKQFNIPFLRLGSNSSRISSKIYENSEINLFKNYKTSKELENFYNSYQIIGVTCLGTTHSIFNYRKFDLCIIDEATQLLQPTSLRPLFYSKKFILIGDPEQLPPVIRSKDAKLLGAEETLFIRLDSIESTSILTLQYRMNKIITKLANNLTYNGNLICANENIMKAQLNLLNREIFIKNFSTQKWILRTLEIHVDQSVILLNTQNCLNRHYEFQNRIFNNKKIKRNDLELIEKRFNDEVEKGVEENQKMNSISKKLNYINYCEIAIIFYLIEALLKNGYNSEDIGIIASYRAQVELMRKFKENFQNYYQKNSEEIININGLEVNTVDQYQGRDKEIIFYSCTRTTDNYDNNSSEQQERKKETEILEDRRRLTVAITRSKHKLIIIGDEKCLNRYTPFKDLFSKIPNRCKIILEDSKFGFSWNVVLEKLKNVMTLEEHVDK